MASVVNARDILLASISPRMVGVGLGGNITVDPTQVPGLPATMAEVATLGKILFVSAPTQVFKKDASGNWDSTTIVITAHLSGGLSGAVTWVIVSGTYTGSLTDVSGTLTIDRTFMTTDQITVRASVTDSVTSVTYTDDIDMVKLVDGSNQLIGYLTNEAHALPADPTGVITSYAGAGGSFKVFFGITDVTASSTFSVAANPDGVTQSISNTSGTNGNYSVTSAGSWASASTATSVTYTATYLTFSVTKVFTLAKAVAGVAGGDATAYWETVSAGAIKRDTTNALTPTTVTVSALAATGALAPAAYGGRFAIATTTNGSTFTNQYTSVANESSKTFTVPTGTTIIAVRFRLYKAGTTSFATTTDMFDEQLVPIVIDGSKALTPVLTNHACTIPCDATGAPSTFSGTAATMQVFEGGTALTYVTSGPTAGQWTFTETISPTGSISTASITGTGTNTATIANRSSIASGTSTLVVTSAYAITAVRADGTSVSLSIDQTFTKSLNGTAGTAGVRGSLVGNGSQFGIRPAAWSDTLANRVIENMNTGGTGTSGIALGSMTAPGLIVGDTVTLGDGNPWWTTLGAWSSATAYVQNDISISSGIAYRALQAGTNKTPASNTDYWIAIGTVNARGAWATGTSYAQSDTSTSGGTTYLAKVKHTSGATLAADLATPEWTQTKYWGGAAWLLQGSVVDGNLLVKGTMSADKIFGGTINGVTLDISGTVTGSDGNATAYFNKAGGGVYGTITYSGSTGAVFGKTSTSGALTAVYGLMTVTGGKGAVMGQSTNIGTPAMYAYMNAGGSGYALVAEADVTFLTQAKSIHAIGTAQFDNDLVISGQLRGGGTPNTDAAVIGYGTGTLHGGRFHHSSGRAGFIGSGSSSFNYDFYADGSGTNYGPFTGAHDALIPSGAAMPEVGDIVVDVKCLYRGGVSNTIFEVAVSSKPRQKSRTGVASMAPVAWDISSCPAALKTWVEVEDEHGNTVKEALVTPDAVALERTHLYFSMNAVGEGMVNVCGENGDIEAGDFIVTSSMAGKGMRQDDDVFHNYTVASARETVTFDFPAQVKTIACKYLTQ